MDQEKSQEDPLREGWRLEGLEDHEVWLLSGGEKRPPLHSAPRKGVVYELTALQREVITERFGLKPSTLIECLEEAGTTTWTTIAEWATTPDGEKVCTGWTAVRSEPAFEHPVFGSLAPTTDKNILRKFSISLEWLTEAAQQHQMRKEVAQARARERAREAKRKTSAKPKPKAKTKAKALNLNALGLGDL